MSADPNAHILLIMAYADGPVVNFDATKHLLTVTDPVTHVTATIKIVGTGSFAASLGPFGTTAISDRPANPAGVPKAGAQLLAQSMASFGAGSGTADSGSGNPTAIITRRTSWRLMHRIRITDERDRSAERTTAVGDKLPKCDVRHTSAMTIRPNRSTGPRCGWRGSPRPTS